MAKPMSLGGTATEKLWQRYRRCKTREIRNELVETYLPLVRGVARRLAQRLPPSVDAEDLVSSGVFGLVRAVEQFDIKRGVVFEAYCRKRVAGAMIDELRKQDWVPREARERAATVRRMEQELRESLGREPTEREIAKALGVQLGRVKELLGDRPFAAWLPLDAANSAADWKDGHPTRIEPVDGVPEPSEVVFREELLGMVDEQLTKKERTILRSYYGDEQTMKRIGSRLRISESRVSQMHNRVLNRLKKRLHQEVSP